MSRYAAALGLRPVGNTNSDPKDWPFIILVGPSGQCTTVPGPSGVAGSNQSDPNTFFGHHHAMNHSALEWFRNEIVTSWKNSQSTGGTDFGYAWQPYGQDDVARVNDTNYNFENNVGLSEDAMFDGNNWKIILYNSGNISSWAFRRIIGGGVFWSAQLVSAYEVPANYGLYTGKDPVRTGEKGGTVPPSGWRPQSGLLGRAPTDVISSAHFDSALGNIVNTAGVRSLATNVASQSTQVIDIAQHRETIYQQIQHGIVGLRFGGKGQYVFSDRLCDDTFISPTTLGTGYTKRLSQQVTGTTGRPRSLAVHRDNIFMLSNEGKVFRVLPNTVREIADLTTLGTPWSSGVQGAQHAREPLLASGPYGGTLTRRPFLISFNNQLHAFLNWETDFQLAKGVTDNLDITKGGRGVLWATSFDGINWTDFSVNLPASGIHSPSGGGVTAGLITPQVLAWESFTAPYRFSGLTGPRAKPIPESSGFDYPAGYLGWGIGSNLSGVNGAFPAQPSGFRQTAIPLWTSGNMIDPLGTPFDQLTVPLEFGAISGYLFPTFIRYPAGFGFQSAVSGGKLSSQLGGVILPSGVGPSGYDYTGCANYHVDGYVDLQREALQLYFTRDLDGDTLFFELSRASGWTRRNWTPNSKQLCGYRPIMLYDPEVVIASGSVEDPNPAVDEVNKRVTLKYKLYDWPFWDKVDVVSEYSIDRGLSWNFIRRQKELSTGSQDTDPSGVIGVEQSLVWNYTTEGTPPLSKNQHFPHVQFRLIAVDPDFAPKNVAP